MGWNDVTNKNNSNSERPPYAKLTEGNTIIRVLDEEPYSFWQHWINKARTSAICGEPDCPICEIIKNAKKEGIPSEYQNSRRHAMRIWNYTTNRMEILIQGRSFMNDLYVLHKEVGDIREYDIKVVRKGLDKSTTYSLLPMAVSKFEHEDEIEDIDLPEIFKPTKREVTLKLMVGIPKEEAYSEE